jgi:photosystem II stability/assembly factor-like uncharacterized protein
VHQESTAQLLVTADAGNTWQARALPGDPATKDAGVDLVAGHSLMLWLDGTGRLALGGYNQRYWTTSDSGATWQESATPRDTGPGASLATFAADDRLTFLTTPPPGGVPVKKTDPNPVIPATDGSFWTACGTGGCVRVTRDHGATWQTLSTMDDVTAVDWVASYDGRTVYASVHSGATTRLVRSTDGGTVWARVLELGHPAASGLALPDGGLILAEASEAGGVYQLPSGTTQLRKLDGAPTHPSVLYLSGGVAVAAQAWDQRDEPNLGSLASISTNGGTAWTTVPVPAG